MQYVLSQDELDALKAKANPEMGIVREKLGKFFDSLAKSFRSIDDPSNGKFLHNVIHYQDLKKAIDDARKDAGL